MTFKLSISVLSVMVACTVNAANLTLASNDIADNRSLSRREVFQGFGCEGANTSPELTWSNAPVGTKSFAVTVYDPDAPTGSGWWHWTVVNIPASVSGLTRDAGSHLPKGAIQGRNDYGQAAFGGVCPPQGDKPHHYQFTVWALKVDKLPLDETASGALVGYMLNANALAKATLTPVYQR